MSCGAATAVSKFLLGDLVGAASAVQVIVWFVSFAIFLAVGVIDVADAPAVHNDER